jgi:ATP-dependent protease ClpP protease subunit
MEQGPAILGEAFRRPQAAGFRTIIFTGTANLQTVLPLISAIQKAKTDGAPGVWVGLHSDGGSPGAARFAHSQIAALKFPAIAHVTEVFSEGASLAAAFPHRSIAPTGKIGFHQAAMHVTGGPTAEAKLSDLLQQCKGHNRAMIAHLQQSFDQPLETVTAWVYDGAVFVGPEAKAAGIVHEVVEVELPNPDAHIVISHP